MRRLFGFVMAVGICGTVAAQGYRPDFDPSRLKGPATGAQNEVLVLGSPHLSQLPPAFEAANLQLLRERLAGWAPQAIAIEALSGAQCDALRRYPHRYKESVKSFCWDPAAARAATGLGVPEATAQAEELLAGWPATPSAAQRRRLAALFLAGGEQASAMVQWLRLAESERQAGDGLDAALVERLRKLETRRDESYMIGAHLAARLGHERVYAMDDHTADRMPADEQAYGAAIMKSLGQSRDKKAPAAERGYVGYWETRNLRMAANIRDAMTLRPGSRMLVIVGASHKGYLEAYLHQMHDMRVVDTAPLLR